MIEVVSGPEVPEAEGDALIVPAGSGLSWGNGADWVADQLGDSLVARLKEKRFSGKRGQRATIPGENDFPFRQVVFIGEGDGLDTEGLRRAAASAARRAIRYKTVVTTLHTVDTEGAAEAVVFGFLLGQYRFEKYLSKPKPSRTRRLVLAGERSLSESAAKGRVLAEAVALARDLVNEPAGAKPPAMLADKAVEIARAGGLDVNVYDESEIKAEGFGGLAAVAAGASNPARMVVLRHSAEGATCTVAFVGKGVVFDSGGLSLKSPSQMEKMKGDMAGAAAVLAAIQAIAALNLQVNIVAITPFTENMIGGNAQRPGDVFRARNGKTVEVLNTDAEGRLILADGLSLAAEDEPDLIVDIATLTGGAKMALGTRIGALFASHDDVASIVTAAAERAGEQLWRLPLELEYRKHIESDIADLKNQGKRYGSPISAALFLSEFVGDTPWAHIDMSGPARASSRKYYLSKGGTGFGVRTLVEIATAMAE
jgi:leucyl aminopeptidase